MTCMRARTSSNFRLIGPLTAELAALERLKKSPYAYNWKNDVSTFSWLFLIGSFSYLQVMITYMREWMSLKFGQIQPSNINISATSGPMASKFYLKHHWVGGKAALGFGLDWIRTLVSMATESSHRVIMEKTVSPLFLGCFSSDPFHTCRQ